GTGQGDPATSQTLIAAQRAAMAPSVSETGHYNILPPPKRSNVNCQSDSGPNMCFEFSPYSDDTSKNIYRFYAPLFLANGGDANQRISKFVEDVFGNGLTGDNKFGVDMDSIKNELKSQIGGYVQNNLSNANGSENDESLTFAAIDLPMSDVLPDQSGNSN